MSRPDGDHVFRLRVYYEDTDAAGVVYYANYFKFAERARTEMIRDLGFENPAADGVIFAVRQCSADYLKPARLDDQLEIHTRVLDVGGASVRAQQRILGVDGELVRLDLKLACVTPSGRPARLPKDVRRSLEDICHQNGQA